MGIAGWFCAATFAQIPGSFDISPFSGFASGNGKIPALPIGPGGGSANAVAIQPDGKIVLAGACTNGSNNDFCVARLNPDGSLDSSFDGPSGNANGAFLLPIGASNDMATAIAIQPDGKIVIAGTCVVLSPVNQDFCVTRLNADGSLDTSFVGSSGTGNGKFLLSVGATDDFVSAIAIQADGKIVLAGSCLNSGVADFCVARLNVDGSLDADFDGPSGSGNGKFLVPIGLGADVANAIAIQLDGKIVLAGYCSNGSNNDFCMARLNADGSLDTDFDGPSGSGNGKFVLPIGTGNDFASAIAIQPDGKIVLAGSCEGASDIDFCVARHNADGSLDASFDGPSGNGAGRFLLPISSGSDGANAVAIQPDGRIVLAGSCSGVDNDFCVARLNADGAYDTSFDGPLGSGNGRFLLPIGSGSDIGVAMTLQSDGKIVLVGGCANATNTASFVCIARLNGGPFGAKQCSLDIDGDNAVLATTDMLIGTRVALGMTGNAVINGISFAPHAKRNTWPLIRDYLVSQCGMRLQ